jgi:hypothetical protein
MDVFSSMKKHVFFKNHQSPDQILISIYLLFSPLLDYTEGAELVDAVLDVVRKEAEGTDCLQGKVILYVQVSILIVV